MSVANIQLKKRIMRRVYVISFLKRVFHPFILKGAVLVVLIIVGSVLVSVPNVIANMVSAVKAGSFFSFAINTILQTEVLVQIVFLNSLVLVAWLIVDAVRSFSLSSVGGRRQTIS